MGLKVDGDPCDAGLAGGIQETSKGVREVMFQSQFRSFHSTMGMGWDERKMKMQKIGLGSFILAKHGWLAIYRIRAFCGSWSPSQIGGLDVGTMGQTQ
jgi:hypothetical protein